MLPVVELDLGGRPARVLLSTGTPKSMVDRGFAAAARLASPSGRVENVRIQLGAESLLVGEFLQRDLSAGRHVPIDVDAVLGFDPLRRVAFMVHGSAVTVFPSGTDVPGELENRVEGRVFAPLQLWWRSGRPIVWYDLALPTRQFAETKLEGTVRVDLVLETGRPGVIGLPPTLTGLLEQRPPFRIAPFTLGPRSLSEVTITPTEDEAFLGMGALRFSPMVFDGPGRRLWILAPPGHGEEPEETAEAPADEFPDEGSLD